MLDPQPDPDNTGGGIAAQKSKSLPNQRRDFFLRVIIFANGEIAHKAPILDFIQKGDFIIAADGGARHCLSLGLFPKLVIGDLDSLTKEEIQTLEQNGTNFERHPPNKNETDLELALFSAIQYNPKEIIIFGALGARWDMSVANLLLLAHPDLISTPIRVLDGPQELSLVQGDHVKEIKARPGDMGSLIPLLGDAKGITTSGLEFPLDGETLRFGATRGVSNVMRKSTARIALEEGLLLVVLIEDR